MEIFQTMTQFSCHILLFNMDSKTRKTMYKSNLFFFIKKKNSLELVTIYI